jgi:hypothetical protein
VRLAARASWRGQRYSKQTSSRRLDPTAGRDAPAGISSFRVGRSALALAGTAGGLASAAPGTTRPELAAVTPPGNRTRRGHAILPAPQS